MKKLLFLGIFSASQIFAATETINTYYDKDFTKPGTSFKDGATVYVAARVGVSSGGYYFGTVKSLYPNVLPWPPEITSLPNIITIFFGDFDNDGTYTGEFDISSEEVTGKLTVFHGGAAEISVDIDGDGNIGKQAIIADYDPPVITKFEISDRIFSPYTSFGIEDTTIITLQSPEDGTYILSMEGKELNKGTIAKGQDITFVWDGKYWDEDTGYWEEFSEGSHRLDASIFDIAGNEGNGSKTITIDSTDPYFTQLDASPLFFSPGTSTGSKDETTVIFSSSEEGRYEISIDGLIPTGSYFGDLSGYWGFYTWDGSYTMGTAEEGEHIIKVTIFDRGGNYKSKEIIVTIDRQWPEILSLTENTGGDVFYRDEVIQFTLKARDRRGDIGTITADNGVAYVDFDGRSVPLYYCFEADGGSIYQGFYTIRENDYGTYTVFGSFTDKGGNPSLNNGTNTSTIYVDGSRKRPTQDSIIGRLGMLNEKENRPSLADPDIFGSTTSDLTLNWQNEDIFEGQKIKVIDKEREHIWVSTADKDKKVILNNGLLYYGEPIVDYRSIEIDRGYALKKVVKGGDNLIFSLEAFRALDEIIPSSITLITGSITVYSSKITMADKILVKTPGNISCNIWVGSPTENGSFTISNANLYSGEILSDYSNLSLSVYKVLPARGGNAMVDIGNIRKNIPLSDDGIDGIGILSGDIMYGDGIYAGVYTVREGDDTGGDTKDAPIYGHFIYNNKWAVNDPYSDSRLKVIIDATPPVITNNRTFPSPFNPYLGNCTIKYNISESAWVKVEIYAPTQDKIRILNIAEPQFGEDLTIFWDGKNSGGNYCSDGWYKYHIVASDLAGNTSFKEGEILLSLVEIKVKNINVFPNPFSSNPYINPSKDVYITFDVALETSLGQIPTEEQLELFGYRFSPYPNNDKYYKRYWMLSETEGKAVFYLPYAIVDFTVFDNNGNELPFTFPDFKQDIEEDPWPSWPGYDDLSIDYELGNPLYADKGDDNANNDYSILCAFDRSPSGYSTSFGFNIVDITYPPGPYVFRAKARLGGIWWNFTLDKEKGEEHYHALPYWEIGLGLQSKEVDYEMVVKEPKPPVLPDDEAPVIDKVNPADGKEFKSGTIIEVWVELIDMPIVGAVGVDFDNSKIYVVDSQGQMLPGIQINDGISKIFWKFDTTLGMDNPGEYKIKVIAKDKNNNSTETTYTFKIRDLMPPSVESPYPVDGAILTINEPFQGPVYVYISERKGESGVDKDKTTISLRNPSGSETELTKTFYTNSDITYQLEGEINPLLDDGTYDGTYTINVDAWDMQGNHKLYSFSFAIKTIFPELLDYQPKGTFNTPYKGTITIKVSEDTNGSGIDWNKSKLWLWSSSYGTKNLSVSYEADSSYEGWFIGDIPQGLKNKEGGTWTIMFDVYDKRGKRLSSLSPDSPNVKWAPPPTFFINPIIPKIDLPYPRGVVWLPYNGTISVKVEALFGIVSSSLSLMMGNTPIPLQVSYPAGTSGYLIGTPTGSLTTEAVYTILATASDTLGNEEMVSFFFSVEYIKPIVSLSVFPPSFSPYGEWNTATISFSVNEPGTYTISVDTRIINIGSYTLGTTSYIWNGKDIMGGTFTEGNHTIAVSLTNVGGITGTGTSIITIDNTPSSINLSISDYRFSPGTSTGIQDTTTITFSFTENSSYIIRVDGESVSSGSLIAGNTGQFIWNPGLNTLEGSHIIMIEARDSVSNLATKTDSLFVDNTWPSIKSIRENTGGKTFYLNEEITLFLETIDTDIESSNMFVGTASISLTLISQGLYKGFYKVKSSDYGVYNIRGGLFDFAGNPGINNDIVLGSVTLDGGKLNPITTSRIARCGIIPEKKEQRILSGLTLIGSTTGTLTMKWLNEKGLTEGQKIEVSSGSYTWITTIKNQEATISNAELYYGSPIADYRGIIPQGGYSLKTTLKKDDKLIISLTAVKIENIISNFIMVIDTTSLIITSPDIKEGGLIVVSDNIHTWLSHATQDGSYTISNQNLYSGPLVLDYKILSGLIVEEASWATGGNASADIGVIAQGIQLVDNGMLFDKISGDGIYSGFYSIKQGDNGMGVLINGHFIYNNYNALNDPYMDERMKIDIDGTKPIIKNQNVEPNPFNPYIKNLSIKYNLSEYARVQIDILDKVGEVIKNIIPPNPKSGENISDFWDGRDNKGDIVPDGFYYYTINAVDFAGNEGDQVKGEIKVTSVEIRIENLIFSPNPFYSDDIPESSDVLVKFRAVLKSSVGGAVSNAQLNNLGFDFIKYSNHLNIPYSLLNFETYDESGNKILHTGYPDMTGGVDIDPWLYSLRDGQWTLGVPLDYYGTTGLGNPLKPDKGDGDTENDNGTLIPFLRDDNGNYYCNYEYGELDWKNPPGNYTVRIWAELVSIAWELKSAPKDEEEKWHAEPLYHGHYKLRSDVLDGIMRQVTNPEIITQDKSPPSIISSSPLSGDIKDPGSVSSVWVKLGDGNGVGVHPINSRIYLEDALGYKIDGVQKNDGRDTIYWELTNPLTVPGTYTIKISAIDFNNNSASYSVTFSVVEIIEKGLPDIQHTKPSSAFVNEKIPIIATVVDNIGVASVVLYYYPVGLSTIETINMSLSQTNTFTCNIPGQANKGSLEYWISATDNNGNVGSKTYKINVITKDEASIEKSVYTSPNPAKGKTRFKVYLVEANTNVKIELYAITGELVWEYEEKFADEGPKNIPSSSDYNCINKNGAKLGTGLYIYKVTIEYPTRKEKTIKKMVIIKQ